MRQNIGSNDIRVDVFFFYKAVQNLQCQETHFIGQLTDKAVSKAPVQKFELISHGITRNKLHATISVLIDKLLPSTGPHSGAHDWHNGSGILLRKSVHLLNDQGKI